MYIAQFLFANNDIELEHEANGNVILYGDREFTWTYGRSLASVLDGMDEYTYTYDENGIRTSKTVDDVATYYNTKDGVILSQTDGENAWYFQYDTSGTPLGFILNDVQYFYITNQMNDILAITDTNGDVVGNYEYDAWGKVLTADTDLAKQNPLRYRGYYYDNETGYYYLQSRYYDSNICRFINADDAKIPQMSKEIVNGNNLYSYCYNDSINKNDYNGYGKNIYVFFYYHKKSNANLDQQAKRSTYYNYYSKNVYAYAIDSLSTFAKYWNKMRNPYRVYLYFHGGKNKLVFYYGNCTAKQLYNACNFNDVQDKVYLFSCHGGSGTNTQKIAYVFAKLSNTVVYASPVGVSYGYFGVAGERYAKIEFKYYFYKSSFTYWHKYRAVYKNKKWYYYDQNTYLKKLLY